AKTRSHHLVIVQISDEIERSGTSLPKLLENVIRGSISLPGVFYHRFVLMPSDSNRQMIPPILHGNEAAIKAYATKNLKFNDLRLDCLGTPHLSADDIKVASYVKSDKLMHTKWSLLKYSS